MGGPLFFKPTDATGVLEFVNDSDSTPVPLGSCAAFRQDRFVLTAAHCVAARSAAQMRVVFPGRKESRDVVGVVAHPTADVAVVETEPREDDVAEGRPMRAFWDLVDDYGIGEEFIAYGFPVEGPKPEISSLVTPRVFRGHYQRFLYYQSPLGYQFLAGELNIPAPGGLSGGPIFREGAFHLLTGIVVENLESYATLDSVEDVSGPERVRIEHHRIISYGIALMLDEVGEWLDEVVPSHKDSARNRQLGFSKRARYDV